jgi:hypothetical protein
LEPVILIGEDRAHEAPDGLGKREFVGQGFDGEVDEPFGAEPLPASRPGLDDAVGLEKQVVAGFESFLDYVRRPRRACDERLGARIGRH